MKPMMNGKKYKGRENIGKGTLQRNRWGKPHPARQKRENGMQPKEFEPGKSDLITAGERAKKIYSILKKEYPEAKCALEHADPLELMIATILAAQCTDERVNIVTKTLFKKYRRAGDYLKVPQSELESEIRSTGFFRNKAKNIQGACRDIVGKFGGEVPRTMEELTSLPGVGRKTANVLLGNVFGTPGIITDTHMIRLSRLMGLSRESEPVKLEFDLMKLLPRKDWTLFSHVIVFHGRRVCIARKPDCEHCKVRAYCSYGSRGINA
jgi:endonuclease III